MTEVMGDNIDGNVKGLEGTKADTGPGKEDNVNIVDGSESEKGKDAAKINEEVDEGCKEVAEVSGEVKVKDSFKFKVAESVEEMVEENCKVIGDVSTENTTGNKMLDSIGATENSNNASSAESNTTDKVDLVDDVAGNKLVCENEGEKAADGKDENKNVDATEEQDESSEEMINLPDTFFDDLMDVEFLGSFDVVDSWKQDEDIADEGKGKEKYSERNEKNRSSKYDDKGRRINDNDRNRSARSSRNERRRSRGRDWYDKNRGKDGRSRYGGRSDRSKSRSKKEGTAASRLERARSRQRRERSASKTRKRSASRTGKRSASRTMKSPSKTVRRSASRVRKRSTSRPRSVSKQRRDRSKSRPRKERSNSKLKNESLRNSVEMKEKKQVEDQNEKDRPASPKRAVQLPDTCMSALNNSGEPLPPGLEDLVPPGEEPLLIRSNLETFGKDTNSNQEKLDNVTPKENSFNDENLPVGKQKLQPADKNETNSLVKRRDYNAHMRRKPDAGTKQKDEAVRNLEMTQRSKEYDGASRRDMSSSDLSQRRRRSPVVVEMSHPSLHQRSFSNEREPRDRSWYRTRERPVDSDLDIERDIRHFAQLRKLEKEEREKYTDLDPESIQSWKDHRDRSDYYSSRERYRSPSLRLSLSPMSFSPARSRFSRSRSRQLSRSRHRSRDYRQRRSRSARSDSLRSLSLSSLSSENTSHSRRRPTHVLRRHPRRQPFFEEIAQKLGIQTNSQEYPPYHHELAGGAHQAPVPFPTDQRPLQQHVPPFSLPSVHVPPPNLAVPPPMHAVGPGPLGMVGPPPPLQGGFPPPMMQQGGPPPVPFQQMPAPTPGPVRTIVQVPFTHHPPPATAPAQPVFNVESTEKESRSLASYLEASLKGDAEVAQSSPPEKRRKADEDGKLLSCVKLEVVKRCEEAVVAVRAENALSMAPLGRVIIQPKVPGSSVPHGGDQVSCFRSPLFDLSNPSFSFTTPPLHDFVSRGLKTAARKLRRSEQSRQESSRNTGTAGVSRPGDGTRKPAHLQLVSVAVNTQISCVNNEWCCKCQAYNVGGAASHSSAKVSDQDAGKRKSSGHRSERRARKDSRGENRDDPDVQIVGVSFPASRSQAVPRLVEHSAVLQGTQAPEHPVVFPGTQPREHPAVFPGTRPREHPAVFTGTQTPRHSGPGGVANPASYLRPPGTTHPMFMPAGAAFRGMSAEQIQRFSSGFAESQRRYQESVRNSNN